MNEEQKETCVCTKNLGFCTCIKEEIKIHAELDAGFADWAQGLEEQEQPEACSIDNPECENCGS